METTLRVCKFIIKNRKFTWQVLQALETSIRRYTPISAGGQYIHANPIDDHWSIYLMNLSQKDDHKNKYKIINIPF